MTKIFLVLISLVAIYLGIQFTFSQAPISNTESVISPVEMSEELKDSEAGSGLTESSLSQYVPFSPEVFSQTAQTRRVLFFYANWCPTCQPADASFASNSTELPEDVTIIRVNYNDTETEQAEKELAQIYEIVYQHTFVQIDSQGQVVAKWNGGQISELLANLK